MAFKMATTPHIVAPTAPHTHTIIFLHGRGSDAKTFCSELFESEDTSVRKFTDIFPSIKWVFPNAPPSCAVTEREVIPQWFDMKSVQRPDQDAESQKEELWQSVAQILEVLEEEMKPVGLRNHCKDDEVVPVRNGEKLRKKLGEWGGVVDWNVFEDGGHWLNEPGGMDGLVEFIQAVMRASPFPIPVKEEKKTEEKPKSRDW
ncbi:uncharacterized protein J4E79_010844 [Alternaria viburni]|uniref:uncharacterized protein n=1 Tax=Alternaria viburni TaxID=566460 RepID=UPI0020C2C490|nr:uncharacterized protein J4E79_010844 [Alternaria viburni]KAI4645307.1 hypothetical protein J4E79_010844 [Alternaria viburni]